jgi:hypothetical protein
VKNNSFRKAWKQTVTLILLMVFVCSVLSLLTVINSVQADESEPCIIILDICHTGEASLSVNAESPLFFELPPLAPLIAGIKFEYPSNTVTAQSQFFFQTDRPPEV